jgi:hypothetical protein
VAGEEGRACGHLHLLDLRLLEPLGLGATVLEPDLDLGLGEVEVGAELCPLGDGKVLLLAELLLQRHELLRRERGARFPVRLVLPEVALEAARRRCAHLRRITALCNDTKNEDPVNT